ncbi:MAG: flagellar brake protein [Methylobacterium sp.]|nr:flagellar brake protein [Methylobacterium sp.]
MMQENNPTILSFELMSKEDNTRYLLNNAQEILRVLRSLTNRNEMVSAFFNGGSELLLTTMLAVDTEKRRIILDYGSNPQINERILQTEKIILVASLDGVKVQFISNGLEKVTYQGRDAFSSAIPAEILHMQQREYYRLTTPILNPLKCVVPLGAGELVELALADIGAGGIGLMLGVPPGLQLKAGETYSGCRISLPEVGTVEVSLRIQSVFQITLKNGSKSMRAGCQFLDLRPVMQSQIQRYIVKLERARISNSGL